jgi:hypothetical protein
MSEKKYGKKEKCSGNKYHFHIHALTDEIFIAKAGGINSYEPRDPIAVSTGNKTVQFVEKMFTGPDVDQHTSPEPPTPLTP